ncbi:MAG: glycosyltransferase family protein [Trueperaceae bacterium]|nr:glycosyltransferase family protein [Trueperaceae bacterium]
MVIVQARMGSTRLPGKVLMDLEGRPMLERQLERLARARTPDAIVIATSKDVRDQPIVDLAERLHIPFTRGSEEDVLDRYTQAARTYEADVVARVTADCPLVDPAVLDQCVHTLADDPSLDYASNTLERTYPRGLDVEAMTRSTLESAAREATDPADREHVTRFIWRQPERFHLGSLQHSTNHSHLRWTVDTDKDLQVIKRIYADLYAQKPDFGLQEALDHAQKHPEVHAHNHDVAQKVI